jgi:hypothetical protein
LYFQEVGAIGYFGWNPCKLGDGRLRSGGCRFTMRQTEKNAMGSQAAFIVRAVDGW